MNEAKKFTIPSLCARSISLPVAFNVPRANSRKHSPKRKSPMYLYLRIWIRMTATRKAGQTRLAMLNENPADMIHAERVVPMLAPIITEMACPRVSNAALTKETVMTVVAAEDWTATQISIPVRTPVKRLVVMAPRMCLRPGPAIFWRASLMTFMPYISRAMEPRSLKIVRIMLQIYTKLMPLQSAE